MDLESYRRREKQNVTEGTVNSRISALRKFKSEANVTGEPEPEDVEKWVDSMLDDHEDGNISPGTMRQYFKSVRYYFERMKGGADEIEHIRSWIPSGGTNHGDFLLRDELDEMRYSAYGNRDRAIIELMYWYARRPSEIKLLNMEDVDMYELDGEECPNCGGTVKRVEGDCRYICENKENQDIECDFEKTESITFPILKKKEAQRATYKMLPEVRQVIKKYLDLYRLDKTEQAEQDWEEGEVRPLFTTSRGRISYDAIYDMVKTVADRAGIDKRITPKSLRHSRATHLDWDGKSPEVIARQQLAHGPDTQTISNYIHDRDEDDVRDVMMSEEDSN